MISAERFYTFVQFEFPWELGPEDGRYLLREHAGEEAHHVLVLGTWTAPTTRRSRRWGRDPAPEPGPKETPVTRATLVDTTTVDEAGAQAWLQQASTETVERAAALLNEAVLAHRAAAADPYVHSLSPRSALVARAGYGAGFEVADGAWTAARELAAEDREGGSRRDRRLTALRPQERLAALLSGRDAVLACEEMALRARADIETGRLREAAMQTHLALEAAIAELQAYREQGDMARRLGELEADRDALAAAANEALQGGLSETTAQAVEATLGGVEAALRARAASASY